ncbi:MAG: PLP-dependent aminotransferase family protein [Ilumatobacter fluminis]|uniref:aminotransferase-like domain-containing protein n=1 Tax=Ilumatobacter fluminis TaxID=467091 RepID=UPI0032F04E94
MPTESSANQKKMDQSAPRTAEQLASLLARWADGPGSLHHRLTESLTELIAAGVLRPGELLPPERRMASALAVARGTVVRSYTSLSERGLVDRIQGSGTRVVGTTETVGSIDVTRSDGLYARHGAAIDLRMAMPSMLATTTAAVARVQFDAIDVATLADTEPAGLFMLRERIAHHLTRQGLSTTPWQIMVTSGAQQAIVLAVSGLVQPGDAVLVEAVTWPGLTDAIAQRGGRAHGVELDREGVRPDALEDAIQRLRPAAIGLNPHHQNPTGSRMSAQRRREIAELAAAYRVPIIEDRALAHLAFDGQVATPLADHAPQHLVVDSINKVAWPGLRIGWLRADADVIERLRPVRAMIDLYSPTHSQLAAIEVLRDWEDIVDERVDGLRRAADLAVDTIGEVLPTWRFARPRGGLVLWAELPGGDAAAFCDHAARHGVLIAPGKQFGVDAPYDDDHVRIPFTVPQPALLEGIERLGAAWRSFERSNAPYPAAAVI